MRIAEALRREVGADVPARSVMTGGGLTVALAHGQPEKQLLVLFDAAEAVVGADPFEGALSRPRIDGRARALLRGALSEANARALQRRVPALAPRLMGTDAAAGCGDRLGLATPGHLRAARRFGLRPFLAQQSIREMERTGRTPGRVMADAVYGVLQEGDLDGFGADADHLKRPEHVDRCLAAGFTFFTLDPSDFVDDAADRAPAGELARRFSALPWKELETSPRDLRARYAGREHRVSARLAVSVSEEDLLRAAVKYGGAIAHTASLYRHLLEAAGARPTEVEVSVDETRSPTSVQEHLFVASELRRLGVRWVSLAPRFVGDFEKGVDYRGDLDRFRADFAGHAEIARELGPYKLSLHSGSDKFSIYGICAELAEGRVHLKTAGTSYLEALRCIAGAEPALLREIWRFALERYDADRATYCVSAETRREADPEALPDEALPELLERDNARQILHVTFGSVLSDGSFRELLLGALRKHEDRYGELVEAHFARHLAPFAGGTGAG